MSYVDSDSYVVVKKEQAVEGVAFEQGPMGDLSGTRGEVAGESSTGGVCVRVCVRILFIVCVFEVKSAVFSVCPYTPYVLAKLMDARLSATVVCYSVYKCFVHIGRV